MCQLCLTLFLLTLKAFKLLKAASLSQEDHLSSKPTQSDWDLFLRILETLLDLRRCQQYQIILPVGLFLILKIAFPCFFFCSGLTEHY